MVSRIEFKQNLMNLLLMMNINRNFLQVILQGATLTSLLKVWCTSSKTQLTDRQTDEKEAGKTNQERKKKAEEEKKEKEGATFHCSVASWERGAAGLWGDAKTGGED